MKVRWLGQSSSLALINGKEYEVMAIEEPFYRIVDESGEVYLYSIRNFEIIEPDDGSTPKIVHTPSRPNPRR